MRSIRPTVRFSSTLVKMTNKGTHHTRSDKALDLPTFHRHQTEFESENIDAGYYEMFLIPNHKLHTQLLIEEITRYDKECQKAQNDIVERVALQTPYRDDKYQLHKLASTARSHNSNIERTNKIANTKQPLKAFKSNIEPLKTPNFLHLAPKPIRNRFKTLKKNWIRQQFSDAFRNETEAEVRTMLDKFVEREIVQNADVFMEELVRYKLKKFDFGNAFSSWSKYAQMERTVAGADQLLEFVLRNDKDVVSDQQSRIKRICEAIQRLFTPSIAFAECVSAYLVAGKFEEAKAIAKYYVISPRSFIEPIKRLGEKRDSKSLEQFAQLFNDIYRENVVQKEATEQSPDPAFENVRFLLQTYRRKKKNYAAKKPKIKKYEVDHRQLESLMKTLDEMRLLASSTKPALSRTPED